MRRSVRAAVAATLMAAGLALLPAPPAGAGQGEGNPRLSASPTQLSADRVTEITVTGTDYLVPPHAPGTDIRGGVYVFFGWVADPGRFGPSIRNSSDNDGTFGTTYAYPGDGGDASTRDDGSGTTRLVSFTEGGESGDATEFHMDRDGNWTTTLRVYGATFTTTNPVTGETRTYDCTEVQCGVFTIGAHGQASATNERFTPVSFAGAVPATTIPVSTTAPTAPPTGGDTASGGGASDTADPDGDASTSSTATTDDSPGDGSDEGDDDGVSGPSSGGDDEGRDDEGRDDDGRDDEVALDVTSVRDTGTSAAPLLLAGAAVVVAAGATGGAIAFRRRRSPHQP